MGLFRKHKQSGGRPAQPDLSNLDKLVQSGKAGDHSAMARAWNVVFGLPSLYLIARGSMPNVIPFIGVLDERPMLTVFCSEDRALEYAKQQGLSFDGPDGFAFISQPPSTVIATACKLHREGVECVVIDDGVGGGYFAPISNLIGMFEAATGDVLGIVAPAAQGEFDHRMQIVAAAENEQAANEAMQTLVNRLLCLPELFVVTSDAHPGLVPVELDDKKLFLIYSDHWSADAGASSLGSVIGRNLQLHKLAVSDLVEAVRACNNSEIPPDMVLVNPTGNQIPLLPQSLTQAWDSQPSIRELHRAS